MIIANLGFRDLQYVIAVAEHQSITRAAEACSITQPALSERIKRIESTLDAELFERSKGSIWVTSVGKRFAADARKLLNQITEIDQTISSSNQPLSGPLHVGTITTLGPYLMPYLLPVLRKQFPDLQLVLQESLTDRLLECLQTGLLDVVIAATPLNAHGINSVDLFHEPLILAAPTNHKISASKKVKAKDLCGDDMVLLEDGHCLTGHALDICPAKQRKNRRPLHATTLETLRQMVAIGAGYTLIPSLAVGPKPPLSKMIDYRELSGKRQYGRTIGLA